MLGHMLGKSNKNPHQKRALINTMSSSQMSGMGRVWKAFMSTWYPLPQRQIKQLVKDKQLISSIFNPKIPVANSKTSAEPERRHFSCSVSHRSQSDRVFPFGAHYWKKFEIMSYKESYVIPKEHFEKTYFRKYH